MEPDELAEQHFEIAERYGRATGRRGDDLDDLVQAGRIAIWQAALSYDPTNNPKPFAQIARGAARRAIGATRFWLDSPISFTAWGRRRAIAARSFAAGVPAEAADALESNDPADAILERIDRERLLTRFRANLRRRLRIVPTTSRRPSVRVRGAA